MCGRYSLASSPEEILAEFGIGDESAGLGPRYNIAPQTPVAVIGMGREGKKRLGMLRWGLVPWWSKEPAIGARMINARAETLSTKPAFREPFERRRCLILADGFYEWKREGSRKIPMRIRQPDGRPFAFAGIWDRWRDPQGQPLHTCAIVTTAANELLRPIHDRMPVILGRSDREAWLDPTRSPEQLRPLLRPFDGPLEAYAVSTIVNVAANDVPECIEEQS